MNRSSQPATDYLRRADLGHQINLHVRLAIPAELTPVVLAELESDRKRRELISQVTGDPLPRLNDPIRFAAERRRITLSHATTGIEAADCELMEQMAASAFKKLDIRVVRRGYACNRDSPPHIAPTLVVEALVPASFNEVSGPQTSASRDGKEEVIDD